MSQTNEKFSVLKRVLMALGIIAVLLTVIIVAAAIYFVKNNPYGIKINPFGPPVADYDHPLLSSEQENTLKKAGIDPKSLPTELSPEQINCAETAIGPERTAAIKAGEKPTISDVLKAQKCVK